MEYVNLEVSKELVDKQSEVFVKTGATDLREFQVFLLIQELRNENFREIHVNYLGLINFKHMDDAKGTVEDLRFYIFKLIDRGFINAIDGKFVVSDMMKNPDVSHIKKVETTGELPEWAR